MVSFQHLFCGELGLGLGGRTPFVDGLSLDGAHIRAFFQDLSSD